MIFPPSPVQLALENENVNQGAPVNLGESMIYSDPTDIFASFDTECADPTNGWGRSNPTKYCGRGIGSLFDARYKLQDFTEGKSCYKNCEENFEDPTQATQLAGCKKACGAICRYQYHVLDPSPN